MKNFRQCLIVGKSPPKSSAVYLPKGADASVAVLLAYFAILIAVAVVEAGLAHGVFLWWTLLPMLDQNRHNG